MNKVYMHKIETIKKLRSFFEGKGATEVFTPIIRKTSSETIKRVKTEFGTYLRNCQEMNLRLMMEYYGDVFEVGSSFRLEGCEDTTHGREFTLLEAQFAGKDLSFLMDLLMEFILDQRSDLKFEEVSVAEIIERQTGINIKTDGEAALVSYLSGCYSTLGFIKDFQFINHYIHEEVEPISIGRCIFFTEYPECTLSLARYDESSKEIIRRFELFINGIEISNGYENSIGIDEFVMRNKKVDIFTIEEEYLERKMREGCIPTNTSIIGIGVERLCMIIFDIQDIRLLLHENVVY